LQFIDNLSISPHLRGSYYDPSLSVYHVCMVSLPYFTNRLHPAKGEKHEHEPQADSAQEFIDCRLRTYVAPLDDMIY
jgi:hypothetical protein